MSRRKTVDDIIAHRLDYADYRPPKHGSGEFFGIANGHLVGATHTVYRNADEEAAALAELRAASRSVVRLAMAPHGCEQLDGAAACKRPGHQAALEDAQLALQVLGLMHYESGQRRWYEAQP